MTENPLMWDTQKSRTIINIVDQLVGDSAWMLLSLNQGGLNVVGNISGDKVVGLLTQCLDACKQSVVVENLKQNKLS